MSAVVPTREQLQQQLDDVRRRVASDEWNPKDYNELQRHCTDLGIHATGPSLSKEIGTALCELTPEHFKPPTLECYDEPHGAELYRFVWQSAVLNAPVYFKYCINDDVLWIFSFHRQRLDRGD